MAANDLLEAGCQGREFRSIVEIQIVGPVAGRNGIDIAFAPTIGGVLTGEHFNHRTIVSNRDELTPLLQKPRKVFHPASVVIRNRLNRAGEQCSVDGRGSRNPEIQERGTVRVSPVGGEGAVAATTNW